MRIGIVGGTGKEGRGLALRWARAGHAVTVGSRDATRGAEAAQELAGLAHAPIGGGDNLTACKDAEVVVLSVPYGAHASTLAELAPHLGGRILVDITVPLVPPKVSRVQLPAGRAAALEARESVGDDVRVVAAFHHVSATHLMDLDHPIETDVLVVGDDPEARELVIALARDLGARGLDAGALDNAIALESITPLLIHMNRRYKSPGSGVRITGIDET
ncbi:MAG: NADPH-dependent F420 reductase [Deltaproteobacteria bacterium]|nr:NADPH-dependent F420 reductase [Deltaproteobacteria bacterium]MCB9786132.1 NADPH-dependent F420 reductase [Deltaproteobacteria bacterium]